MLRYKLAGIAALTMLVSGCGSAPPPVADAGLEVLCSRSSLVRDNLTRDLLADGGDKSVRSGMHLLAVLDAACLPLDREARKS